MLSIGIDPGQKGGIAILRYGGDLEAFPMPMAGKEIDVSALVFRLSGVSKLENKLAIVEKVHSMPKQGVASSFKFGKLYGCILGVLGALFIPIKLVTPQAWKKEILAGTKKDKDAAIDYVSMRYPNFSLIPVRYRKPHDGMADAICLAEYGIREGGNK